MTRAFLAAVGAVYVVFSLWCTLKPATTARAVGFTLSPGSGESEYMVVYGGLQMALGLIFLLPVVRDEFTSFSLTTCVIVHACVMLFRGVSFLRFAGIERTTYILGGLEGVILVVAVALWLRK